MRSLCQPEDQGPGPHHVRPGKLADVALACLDDSQQSTGYWVELLSFRCLQVKPESIMPLSQHFTEPAAVSATGYFGAE